MEIYLEGVKLPELEFVELPTHTGVAAKVEKTLDGVPIIWEQQEYGRPITLKGGQNTGMMTQETLDKIVSMASAVGSEAIYTLQYDGKSYDVRFRHEDGAVEADHIGSHLSSYYNNVTIKLQEV